MTETEAETPAGAYGGRIKLSGLVAMLAWDVGLPLAAYYLARVTGQTAFWSLMAATIVAGLRVVWGAWRHKRIDAFSAFMMTLFALGMVLSAVTGDARWLLVKGCVVTAIAGLVFLGSAALKRPLTLTVGKRLAAKDPESLAELEQGWRESAEFRAGFIQLALLWGFGLVLESILRLVIIYTTSIDVSVAASAAIQILAYAVMIWITIREVKAMRALAEQWIE
ncbi:MAG TPA: VC0807 family protein [Flexivirga sp.]|uniref:VC0807 family protein n=1 Tax=Flexivirga sp. TaxID=1962927 RepID=UPI002C5C69D0|nr:VC0807 family protein [Flexivirga sp.]HWC24682.1 VC0807 family protein [Flexivirga sp.]